MASNILEDIKAHYRQGNAIIRLIMAIIIVHVLLALIYVPFFLFLGREVLEPEGPGYNLYWVFIENWFYFPSALMQIPIRIWTIFTYMFLHGDFRHLFFNMLILYTFGQKLNDLLSNHQIFPIYVWGGIVGALSFAIGFNTFPAFASWSDSNLVGGSAGVMAVVLAVATLNPKGLWSPFGLFTIELQYAALFFVVLDLAVTLPGSNPGGALAHLGGAFMGWLFIFLLRKGTDLSKPINKVLYLFSRSHDGSKVYKKAETQQETFRSKMKVYKGSQKTDYYGSEYGRSFIQKYKDMSREECLNTILDNIKRSGYDGLTEDEKAFLDRYRDN